MTGLLLAAGANGLSAAVMYVACLRPTGRDPQPPSG
jgi:hypothetical protein